MKKFTNKSIWDMTKEEVKYDSLSCELNLEYIKNIIKNNKAVKFENHKDIIVFHPCVKDKDPYQITYIWKKDNKPSGDIICNSIEQAAKEIYHFLNSIKEYIPQEVI
jgi:hypothetical protein